MIRINLLAVEKPVARTRSFSLNLGDKAGPIGAVLVLVAAVSYAGWDYFSMMQRDSVKKPCSVSRHGTLPSGLRSRYSGR